MDHREYKAATSVPQAFRRAVLEASAELLAEGHASIASRIRDILSQHPVPRPTNHSNPSAENDWFHVNLDPTIASEIAVALFALEAAAVSATGESTPAALRAAELGDVWNRLAQADDLRRHSPNFAHPITGRSPEET